MADMKCPKCNGPSRVIETSNRVDGTIRRRRICGKGHRFSTWQQKGAAEKARELAAQGK